MSKQAAPSSEQLFYGVPKQFIKTRSIKDASKKVAVAYDYYHEFVDMRNNKLIRGTHIHCIVCLQNWNPKSVPKFGAIERDSSTGNVYTHFLVVHKKKIQEDPKQIKLTSMFNVEKPNHVSPEYYFLLWVALDNLPLSKVEGKGFKLLMEKIAKHVKIPSRHVVTSRCLPDAAGRRWTCREGTDDPFC